MHSMTSEGQMLGLSDRTWTNGWTGQMVRRVTSTISNTTSSTGIVLCSSTTNIDSTVFCVTQGTMILGSNYVRYASTPQSSSITPIKANCTGLSDGAVA